jgi:superfamily I DNA and/or RNA helicase
MVKLLTQRRMHSEICKLISEPMYGGELKSEGSVRDFV